jgi:putative transposase
VQSHQGTDSESLTKSGLARKLGVSRGTLYYKPVRADKDEHLRRIIEAVMLKHPAYGHRRIADELGVNRKRVSRVMRKFNLKPARRSRQVPYKPDDVQKRERTFADILAQFSPIEPNIVWVADFTFIPFHGGFVYLATVLDFYTRQVLGVSIMQNHTSELVVSAFLDAVERRATAPEYFHSDQGSEYLSSSLLELFAQYKVQPSHSPKKSPWRNGRQESFFGRFKVEFGDPERFSTIAGLIEAIYLHVQYYNNERIHTRLRMAPSAFYAKWLMHPLKITKFNEQNALRLSENKVVRSLAPQKMEFVQSVPELRTLYVLRRTTSSYPQPAAGRLRASLSSQPMDNCPTPKDRTASLLPQGECLFNVWGT